MNDDAIGKLREARALLLDQRDRGMLNDEASRALSITITKIDEAILWRQHFIFHHVPIVNESNEGQQR